MRARDQIKAMLDAVALGDTYDLLKGGNKVAVVVPYDRWLQVKSRLALLQQPGPTPSTEPPSVKSIHTTAPVPPPQPSDRLIPEGEVFDGEQR